MYDRLRKNLGLQPKIEKIARESVFWVNLSFAILCGPMPGNRKAPLSNKKRENKWASIKDSGFIRSASGRALGSQEVPGMWQARILSLISCLFLDLIMMWKKLVSRVIALKLAHVTGLAA